MAILLDCDEVYMRQKCAAVGNDHASITKRIHNYKHNTLPVLGYLEDIGKLEIVMVVPALKTP